MKNLSKALLFGALLVPAITMAANAKAPVDATAAITQQLNRYEVALNASNVDQVMSLYTEDAVFMPQNNLPAVGSNAVRAAYSQVFKAIKIDIRFTIDEIRPLSPDWAFARTRSNGTVKVLNSDQPASAEGNQEVFLLHREADGQWRFARYIFTTTQPTKQP